MLLTTLLLLQILPFWQDIRTTSVNAQTRRTEVIYYASKADALVKNFKESQNYQSLNGEWDFRYFDSHRDMEAFFRKGGRWDKIQVPGNWEVQGYGIPIYVNHPYEFRPKNPVAGMLPDTIPGGIYHRNFTVPTEWKGREVYLNLSGSKSGTYVYVNNKEVGYCEDSKSLARFRITPYLQEGENDLKLKIYRFSQGSFLECQDFWRISGLERDVYLSSEQKDTGFDFSVISTLAEDLETGVFKLKLRSSAPVNASYELLDKDGIGVADAHFSFSGDYTTVTDSIPNVRRWSAETPELYTLVLNVNGEFTRFDVGFRRLEIKQVDSVKVFLVNGQPVKFKGVNLHEHSPYTGHYLTRENILEDLLLMKKANINAIRTCHYPQPREFYELCDSLGFYVYDEANIESHGMGYKPERTLAAKPEWYPKHQDRILNMYFRTANYPCVTILSLGNEAGNGINFQNAYKELKALEENGQNRPVVYERAEYEWNTDMIVPQYPDAKWFEKKGKTYKKRPICPSEYAHAMGNSTGSLDLQWKHIYHYSHLQGGFIWDWVDQALWDKERGWTYGGDYGENAPSDDNFLCNGIVNPDREPHPAFYEVKHVYQNIAIIPKDTLGGVFTVFNRHYFTPLDRYTVRFWTERDGKRPFWWLKRKLNFTTAPQQAQDFKVKLPRMKRPGEYHIFFEVYDGADIVACEDILLKNTAARKAAKPKGSATYTDGDTKIIVRAKDLELIFDKKNGCIQQWKVGGKDMVDPAFGIRPNFWRAATDNDYGNDAPLRLDQFRSPWRNVISSAHKGENGTVKISFTGNGVRAKEVYTIYPDGTIRIDVTTAPEKQIISEKLAKKLAKAAAQNTEDDEEVDPNEKRMEIPRLGFRFRVADNAFTYYGRGPVENYQDRSSGTFKRIWNSSADDEYYPYVRPQECGHHTGTSWLQTGGITVLSADEFEFNVLRQSVEDLDGGQEKSQTHISDVPVRDFTEVCIDYRMTGVGGYDSWGSRPEPCRTLWADQSYTYSFTLVPKKETRFNYE